MTRIDPILEGVYRIATFDEKVGISFNQYIILDDKPALMHTGSATIFEGVLAALKGVVKPEDLAYAFISHFEADECGSLTRFLEVAKGMSAVCPAVTGRQLQGFGLCRSPLVKQAGETLDLGKRRLRFLSYPSEMHLWEGLIAYEETD
ncbi:MAG: MBL fold metallo-hydrolase, partial [Dehalococcoidia bacterium]|nr:MBL fold metallo-hydrolase [Dehalococcoidia bacterium]